MNEVQKNHHSRKKVGLAPRSIIEALADFLSTENL